MKHVVHTTLAPAPRGPYSQGIISSAGRQLYVAAQGPLDPATGEVVEVSFAEQAARAFDNVKAVVESAGATMNDVVKVTIYLTDWRHFSELNAVYQQFFNEPYPARTPVQSVLPIGLIMVDAVAILPDES